MGFLKRGSLFEQCSEDLHFNLALEHVLINYCKQNNKPIFRIWQNPSSVVIGRGQNYDEEVNENYCIKNEITIGRRISGGGAVYHDNGNYNISFVLPITVFTRPSISLITGKLTSILKESLLLIGHNHLSIYRNGSILFKNKKISGSAGYKYKNWYLHHATLLTKTDINKLEFALKSKSINAEDARKSSYYPTTNLQNFDIVLFKIQLLKQLEQEFDLTYKPEKINENLKNLSENLANSLYRRDHWIKLGKRRIPSATNKK